MMTLVTFERYSG